ncbi:hypothetical protein IWZ03DRAFT_386333 [Phyllosticta citriasiana]|uniref:Uncharacterized protein n=1 Tax=Phyllosticta citriasiana TaxID=595635 RepID=A0ABR1KBX1_9PEZI
MNTPNGRQGNRKNSAVNGGGSQEEALLDELNHMKRNYLDVKAVMVALQSQMTRLRSQLADMETENEELRDEIGTLQTQVTALKAGEARPRNGGDGGSSKFEHHSANSSTLSRSAPRHLVSAGYRGHHQMPRAQHQPGGSHVRRERHDRTTAQASPLACEQGAPTLLKKQPAPIKHEHTGAQRAHEKSNTAEKVTIASLVHTSSTPNTNTSRRLQNDRARLKSATDSDLSTASGSVSQPISRKRRRLELDASDDDKSSDYEPPRKVTKLWHCPLQLASMRLGFLRDYRAE